MILLVSQRHKLSTIPLGMLEGQNFGKVLIHIADPS
jgi:NADPH-dependent curcumin reductase CurA